MSATSFTTLVRSMRQKQAAYFKNRSQDNLLTAKKAEKLVDNALLSLPDNRPGIHIGYYWYSDGDYQLAALAAYVVMPPTENGEAVKAVLQVFHSPLHEIASDNDALHKFILKWEWYAHNYYMTFSTTEDFKLVDDRWQLVEDA